MKNMDKNLVIESFKVLGLSEKETNIYIQLLKRPYSNGSQLAKELGLPRTSVYILIRALEEKGFVLSVLENNKTSYVGTNPQDILFKIEKEVKKSISTLKTELKKIEVKAERKEIINLSSEKKTDEMVIDVLRGADYEVYISKTKKLDYIVEELNKLKRRKIKINIVSLRNISYNDFILVADNKRGVMSSIKNGEFQGTFTENKLLIDILQDKFVSEVSRGD